MLTWNSPASASAGAREAAGEDAVSRAVLTVALPDDDEVAVGIRRHRGDVLVARGVGVDLELAGQGAPALVKRLGEDAVARAVLAEALPGDDEVAGAVRRDRGRYCVLDGVAVDLELAGDGSARAREAAARRCRSSRAVLVVARSRRRRSRRRYPRPRRAVLVVGGVGVDLELAGQGERRRSRSAGRRRRTPSHPGGSSARRRRSRRRHRPRPTGVLLRVRGVGVDLELAGRAPRPRSRSGGAKTPKNEPSWSLLVPDEDEAAAGRPVPPTGRLSVARCRC